MAALPLQLFLFSLQILLGKMENKLKHYQIVRPGRAAEMNAVTRNGNIQFFELAN
jgi:hypothetical protein